MNQVTEKPNINLVNEIIDLKLAICQIAICLRDYIYYNRKNVGINELNEFYEKLDKIVGKFQ